MKVRSKAALDKFNRVTEFDPQTSTAESKFDEYSLNYPRLQKDIEIFLIFQFSSY